MRRWNLEVKQWRDGEGRIYREVISRIYSRLQDLKDIYERDGVRAWINPYDEQRWVLTLFDASGLVLAENKGNK